MVRTRIRNRQRRLTLPPFPSTTAKLNRVVAGGGIARLDHDFVIFRHLFAVGDVKIMTRHLE